MSLVCGGELHDNLFLMLSQPHIILAINCLCIKLVHSSAANILQIDGQNDNSVLTVSTLLVSCDNTTSWHVRAETENNLSSLYLYRHARHENFAAAEKYETIATGIEDCMHVIKKK